MPQHTFAVGDVVRRCLHIDASPDPIRGVVLRVADEKAEVLWQTGRCRWVRKQNLVFIQGSVDDDPRNI